MYNPNDKDPNSGAGGKAEPGKYPFRVESALEVTFKSGSEGLEVELAVCAFPGSPRTIKVFERFVFVPKALWKLEQFMNAIGMDFNQPPANAMMYVGKTGNAEFVKGEKGYLEAGEYIAAKANNAPSTRRASSAVATQPSDVPW
jgi:hypothetical protein